MEKPSPRRSGDLTALSTYRDRQFQGSAKEQEEKLKASSTLYIGNLSFFTSEDQIYHLFAKAGDVKRVVMGLDRNTKTPCGFCFVEFYSREDAEDALRYVSGTRLDERIVRCDWDAGFIEGRQYGRGRSGGQVRDEFRVDYDAGRGGFGKMVQNRMERFGPEGGPPTQRRFEGRGKRKWQEVELDSQGEPITDLRQKLRRSNPANPDGENIPTATSDTPAEGQEAEIPADGQGTETPTETAAAEEAPSGDTDAPIGDENNGGEDVEPMASDLEMSEEQTGVIEEVEGDAEMTEDNGSGECSC